VSSISPHASAYLASCLRLSLALLHGRPNALPAIYYLSTLLLPRPVPRSAAGPLTPVTLPQQAVLLAWARFSGPTRG
jgi:hypothetical protein